MPNEKISSENQFLPKNESAKIAVERARKIVKDNNEMIIKLKEGSNIGLLEDDTFSDASNFSSQDSYSFDLYKIKSTNGFSEFFKDIFGTF